MAQSQTEFAAANARVDTDLAMFNAMASGHEHAGIREYSVRLQETMVRNPEWIGGDLFRSHVAEPMLRWGASDPTFPDGWFEQRIKVPPFNGVDLGDIEPAPHRQEMKRFLEE